MQPTLLRAVSDGAVLGTVTLIPSTVTLPQFPVCDKSELILFTGRGETGNFRYVEFQIENGPCKTYKDI